MDWVIVITVSNNKNLHSPKDWWWHQTGHPLLSLSCFQHECSWQPVGWRRAQICALREISLSELSSESKMLRFMWGQLCINQVFANYSFTRQHAGILGSFSHLMVPDAVSWRSADPCAESIAVSCSVKSFGNCISKNLGHKVAGRHGLAVVMLSCWVCSDLYGRWSCWYRPRSALLQMWARLIGAFLFCWRCMSSPAPGQGRAELMSIF